MDAMPARRFPLPWSVDDIGAAPSRGSGDRFLAYTPPTWGACMAGYSDYYSTLARAVSGQPGKTEEARAAVYEIARTALQKRLSAFDPPISEADLAIERFALEAAIQRVETESRFDDTRHGLSLISMVKEFVGSLRHKLDDNITAGGDKIKAAITACRSLDKLQALRLTAPGRRLYNIFGDRRWITKYPQIRIALRLVVAALIGIFAGILLRWMTDS
jgi:hypothetical protein